MFTLFKTKFYFILNILIYLAIQTNLHANILDNFSKIKLTECNSNSNDIFIQKLFKFRDTLCHKLNLKYPSICTFKIKKQKLEYNAFATYVAYKKTVVAFGDLFLKRWREGWLSDQEIEAIMAHELSHIKCNHLIKIGTLNLAIKGPFLVCLVKAPFLDPKELFLNAYSRKSEKEADIKAIKIIDDPMSLFTGLVKLQCLIFKKPENKESFEIACETTVYELIKERKSFLSPLVELLSTHPLTSNRMEYIRKFAAQHIHLQQI